MSRRRHSTTAGAQGRAQTRRLCAALAFAAISAATVVCAESLRAYRIVGDAIPEPLAGGPAGDPGRGRAIVLDRNTGNCLICHHVPEPSERFMGTLAPDLAGVGTRLSTGQLRLRLVDQSIVNPLTIMPPYHRVEGLTRVPARFQGVPLLSAAQIEDVVAYLASLKE